MIQVEFVHSGRRIGADLIPTPKDSQYPLDEGQVKGKVMVHIEGKLVGLGRWIEPKGEPGFIWGIHPQNGLTNTGLTEDDYSALSDALNRAG